MNQQSTISDEFNKEFLLKCLFGIYDEAFSANCAFLILKQIINCNNDKKKTLDCSPAFYSVVCSSLVKSSIMDLMRIYDKSSHSIGIEKVINYCNKWEPNISPFFEDEQEIRPLTITLSIDDMKACEKNEELKNKLNSQKKMYDNFNLPYDNQIKLDLTVKEFFRFCSIKKKHLNDAIDMLYTQRKKVYAHNDTEILFDIKRITEENKITYENVSSLIDFALKFCVTTIYILSGEQKGYRPKNIDDVSITWMHVNEGRRLMKNRDQRILNEIKKVNKKAK